MPNVPLRNMLSVRRAANRQRAEERLNNQKVDFVVCGEDGRPLFAFDVEQYHLSDVKAKAHQAKIKNRMLKTAGVRFLVLKQASTACPRQTTFREQLNLAALPRPKLKRRATDREPESVRQQLESQFAEYEQTYLPATELPGVRGHGHERAGRAR